MKFLRVGSNKLKISLTMDESKRYNIQPTDENTDRERLKEVVFALLSEAKDRCGFSLGSDKALIQIYPSDEFGAELLVTKLTTLAERERDTVFSAANISTVEERMLTFRFESAEDLGRAARAVCAADAASDIYLGDDGCYYIAVRECSLGGDCAFLPFLEFGTELEEMPYDVMRERGRLIAGGNALRIVSEW